VVANPAVARAVASKHGTSGSAAAKPALPGTGVSGSRAPGPASEAEWGWLRRAAEMATQAGSLSAAARAGLRSAPGPGWPCYPRIAMRTPGTEPGAISAARKFTTLILERWGAADRGSDVAVVVSELLSNAVRHGLAPADGLPAGIRLGLLHAGPSILCAVTDPSDTPPVPRDPDWLDEGGRGLHVIASLSDGWGSCPDVPGQPGKVVWAAFRTAP
jgi:anti-sigma regulatory factor (Ser/Thr protein kinase)